MHTSPAPMISPGFLEIPVNTPRPASGIVDCAKYNAQVAAKEDSILIESQIRGKVGTVAIPWENLNCIVTHKTNDDLFGLVDGF